eukprot:8448567-Pyramimonas_sp.AAC.1
MEAAQHRPLRMQARGRRTRRRRSEELAGLGLICVLAIRWTVFVLASVCSNGGVYCSGLRPVPPIR